MNYLVLIVQDRIVYITAGHKAMDFYKNRGTNDTLCDNVQ